MSTGTDSDPKTSFVRYALLACREKELGYADSDKLESLLQNSMKTLKSTNFQVRKGTPSPLNKSLCSSGDRVPFPT